LERLFLAFLNACEGLPSDILVSKRTKRFNIALFEAVFAAACRDRFRKREIPEGVLDRDGIRALDEDSEFLDAAQKATTQTANVNKRLSRARHIIQPL
jgi:hypothetical protein